MLQPNLADQPVSDFQHWPPWRPLVVATATELARFTGQHLIAPQTILVRAYLEQIFAGLRDAGLDVFHVVLDADRARGGTLEVTAGSITGPAAEIVASAVNESPAGQVTVTRVRRIVTAHQCSSVREITLSGIGSAYSIATSPLRRARTRRWLT